MSIGVSTILDSTNSNEIMIIGLGGGSLCTFLYHCFSNVWYIIKRKKKKKTH